MVPQGKRPVLWTARLTNACFGMHMPTLHVGMYLVGLRFCLPSRTGSGTMSILRVQAHSLCSLVCPCPRTETHRTNGSE